MGALSTVLEVLDDDLVLRRAGILMDTFLVRALLIPSTVVLLGRLNWWPSRLSRPDQAPSLPPEPEPERAATPS